MNAILRPKLHSAGFDSLQKICNEPIRKPKRMKHRFVIAVTPDHLDDDSDGYFEIKEWFMNNPSIGNVLELTEYQVNNLQYFCETLNIINDHLGSMIEVGEDDWIIENEVKSKIKSSLEANLESISNSELADLNRKIIDLLELSIRKRKNIYFMF